MLFTIPHVSHNLSCYLVKIHLLLTYANKFFVSVSSTNICRIIMPLKLVNVLAKIKRNQKGLISVFGAFLLQLCVGSYHGTFGNLLPYLTSYLRKVIFLKAWDLKLHMRLIYFKLKFNSRDILLGLWWWSDKWGCCNDNVCWWTGAGGQFFAGWGFSGDLRVNLSDFQSCFLLWELES